jgi:PhzF family phenazine biosynthesis protein
MQLPIYQIDAFTSRVFAGNPAAVCPLDAWLPDATMQSIAAENNLSETAYFVRENGGYRIRWFTPGVEVDLCGHATLASGYLLLARLTPEADTVEFASRSGPLCAASGCWTTSSARHRPLRRRMWTRRSRKKGSP